MPRQRNSLLRTSPFPPPAMGVMWAGAENKGPNPIGPASKCKLQRFPGKGLPSLQVGEGWLEP